jgi:flagellar hook-length control protein FliK
MDLNLFATQVAAKGQTLSSGNSALLGAGNLGNTLGGVDSVEFWNTLLGSLADGATETTDATKKASNSNQKTLLETEALKKEKVDLALLQLALMGQDIDKSLDEKLSELRIERIANNPENRIEQLTKLIDHLTSGLPSAVTENNTNVGELVARLAKRLETLESSLEAFRTGDFGDEGAPFKMLIATGLNPSQITKITNRIEEVETKLGRELTVEDLIAGVGNIIPAPGDDEHEFSAPDALQALLETKQTSEEIEAQKKELAKQELSETRIKENIKNSSKNDTALGAPITTLTNAQKVAPAGLNSTELQSVTVNGTTPAELLTTTGTLEKPLQQMSNAEFKALFKGGTPGNGLATKASHGKNAMAAVKGVATLPTLPKNGDIVLSSNWAEALPASNILSELAGFNIQSGTPFSNIMQAVNHVTATNAQSGQTHPATSMVAAKVSKAAQNTETRQMTLQLDPPELGRVEIRLEFGDKKSVQAHLIVEKPETLLMLQRDMSALEKALQDAGLDTDSGSLNYEMAAEDYNFNSNRDGNSQNGETGSSGENAENSEDEIIIETTMTWDVDPETGHVHYSLLA